MKVARCEHCGKVSLMRRASLAELCAVEQAELEKAASAIPTLQEGEAEKLAAWRANPATSTAETRHLSEI